MMGMKPQEINRLTDLSHNTKIETVTAELHAMNVGTAPVHLT